MADRQTRIVPPPALILVAEIEPTSRSSLSDLLRDEGHRVVEANDSAGAITQISYDPSIKVILSDLEMPSWRSLITHARTNLPAPLILGMVRFGALANALEAQQLGAHAYLVKPLSFTEVSAYIQRFLTGQSLIKR